MSSAKEHNRSPSAPVNTKALQPLQISQLRCFYKNFKDELFPK